MKVAITVDVEIDYGGRLGSSYRGVMEGIPKLLTFFKQHNVKATFFVVASLIPEFREVIEEIEREGHEIACHGFNHEKYNDPYLLNADLEKCKQIYPFKGFRSPYFITCSDHLKILNAHGFVYDSSKVPTLFPGRFNYLGTPSKPHKDIIWEVPVSTVLKIPFGLSFVKKIGLINNKLMFKGRDSVVFYCHAHEFVKFEQVPKHFKNNNDSFEILEKLITKTFRNAEFVEVKELTK